MYTVRKPQTDVNNELAKETGNMLTICVAHFMKSVANQCAKKIGKKTKAKEIMLNIFALLVDCDDIFVFDKLFELMCFVSCSQTTNKSVVDSLKTLQTYCNNLKDTERVIKVGQY